MAQQFEARNADEMIAYLRAGKTLVMATYTRTMKITPKTLAKFEKVGASLFRQTTMPGGKPAVLMARGRSFDNVSYCAWFVLD